jgi:DNA-binding NarL/FixJ family response regulator
MKKIKVSVVEDSGKLRRVVKTLLNEAPDLDCHCTCSNGEEALEQLPQDPPKVVLMDIRLPGMSGIECTARLVREIPLVRVIMWTAHEDDEEIFSALAAGAHGYLMKGTEPEKLLDAVREVAAGGSPISGNVARKMVEFFRSRKPPTQESINALAPREKEVLKLLADGCPYKEIADVMEISLGTVRTYIQRIYEKLHVHSRTEAVVKFLDRGGAR